VIVELIRACLFFIVIIIACLALDRELRVGYGQAKHQSMSQE